MQISGGISEKWFPSYLSLKIIDNWTLKSVYPYVQIVKKHNKKIFWNRSNVYKKVSAFLVCWDVL